MSLFSSYSNSKNTVSCIWTAYRGDIVDGTSETVDSPQFGPRHCPEIKFGLRFERGLGIEEGTCNPSSGSVFLRLLQTNTEDKTINVQCKFQLGTIPDGAEKNQLMETNSMGICRMSDYSNHHLKIFHAPELEQLFGNSTCIIMHCEVSIRDLNPKYSNQAYHNEHLSENMIALRRDPARYFSDITLKTNDGRDFLAHRNILCSRSKVFAAMFANEDFVESKEKKVEIPDIAGEVMEALLDYVYTANITNIGPLVGELLEAADKYDIQPLIRLCVAHMHCHIDVSSAAKIFYLADLHHIEPLKNQALDYISHNAKEVRESAGWNAFIRPKPDLIEALFDYMADRRLFADRR